MCVCVCVFYFLLFLPTRIIRKYVHDFVKAASIVHNMQSLLKLRLTDLF